MKERPILFSAPMVRAILEGRKTQTRRVVKRTPLEWLDSGLHPDFVALPENGLCPYGQPGDRLWVRETWQGPLVDDVDDVDDYRENPDKFRKPDFCEYAADGGPAPEFVTMDDDLVQRWRPSIHMPRWASRILLEVVSVRVERLNDISEPDAMAEGVTLSAPVKPSRSERMARDAYAELWESINGPGSWEANPWVWVVEFKRVIQ